MEYNGDESKGIRLYNGAQTGTTTVEFAAQAANLAAITTAVKADLVTIELGGNDFGRNSDTPAQAAANLTTMVKDIRSDATGHEPSIVLVTVYPQDGTNSLGYTWAQYKSAIEGVASANANVGLLDLTSFGTAGVDNGDGGLLASDGIHPSDSGQVKVAGLVGGYIEDY
jgi:lysophospholipase L1-like esterase